MHACSGPAAAGQARDILDILLIDLLDELDYAQTRIAAERVFTERRTHPFPPVFEIPAGWHLELEATAKSLGFPLTEAAQIDQRFREVLLVITNAVTPTKA